MSATLKQKRILLVEDHETFRKVQSWILRDLGYLVNTVENAHQALNMFSTKRFDAVLTDVGLPDMSGAELIHWLRAMEIDSSKKSVPILVITAYKNAEISKECFLAGADAILEKPLTRDVLKTTLERFFKE